MNKDIILEGELKSAILAGINKMSEAVLTTMGPNGNTVIIVDGDKPYITKDGVSVCKSVRLDDPIENVGASLLKEVAERTVEQAGDGTTTSICLAHAFINTGYALIEKGYPYKDIKAELDKIEEHVIKSLNILAKPLTEKDIINVATVSANNDTNVGSIIAEAYKHSSVVKVEESDNLVDNLELVDGMKVLGSYYDKAFINNFKKKAIEYNDCELLIVDGKVNNISELKPFLEGVKTKPVVILADDFHGSVVSILKDNYNRGSLEVGLLKSPGFSTHRRDLVQDIIQYTNCTVNTYGKGVVYSTTVDSILATKDSIIFTKENPGGQQLISNLKDLLNAEEDSYAKELLEQRIENLEGKLSIIKVGGNSEVEMKEKKDRFDDAVLAVKCGLEEGVVKGGGHTLYYIGNAMTVVDPNLLGLSACLNVPYHRINEPVIEPNILDPVKVTRCAFQNAISVAKTILNTEALVIGQWVWS